MAAAHTVSAPLTASVTDDINLSDTTISRRAFAEPYPEMARNARKIQILADLSQRRMARQRARRKQVGWV